MTCIVGKGIVICGNFVKPTKTRPKNWVDRGYKMLVPFDFKWREKIGKRTCDCKEMWEHYQPWYGFSWYHSKDCLLMKTLAEHPNWSIMGRYQNLPLIAQSE